jgi:hypothetical protein
MVCAAKWAILPWQGPQIEAHFVYCLLRIQQNDRSDEILSGWHYASKLRAIRIHYLNEAFVAIRNSVRIMAILRINHVFPHGYDDYCRFEVNSAHSVV